MQRMERDFRKCEYNFMQRIIQAQKLHISEGIYSDYVRNYMQPGCPCIYSEKEPYLCSECGKPSAVYVIFNINIISSVTLLLVLFQ